MPIRQRRFVKTVFDHGQPLARASSLPAVILFTMLLAAIVPLQAPRPHALLIALPVGNALGAPAEAWSADLPVHRVEVTRYNEILWDGEFINMGELVVKAKAATDEDPRPGLIFAPDGDANYDLSAKVLNLLKRTGVTESRFCLGGLAAHRHFGRGQSTPLLFIAIYMPEYELFDPGTPATPPQCDPPVG